jgi:hypothetical protein
MSRSALRTGLLVVAGIALGCGALLASAGLGVAACWVGGWSLLIIVSVAIERWRYKSLADRPPGPSWVATGERFVDPETGKLVAVYHHPGTGERRYVAS